MVNPNLFFSTPVWVQVIDNYKNTNENIHNYIKNLEISDKEGIIRSNIKGWHSQDFNLEDKEPQEFIKLISSEIHQVILDMDWDDKNQKTKITCTKEVHPCLK